MNKEINQKEEISLKEIFQKTQDWYRYFFSNWKIILIIGLVGGLLGLGYAFTQKPKYTALLTFALEEGESGSLGGAIGLASQFGFDIGGGGGGAFEGSNFFTPVKVDNKMITLAEVYIQDHDWRDDWREKTRFKDLQFLPNIDRKSLTRDHDSILGIIYDDISKVGLSVGKKDKKIDIISIEVFSSNEFFAKTFSESLVQKVSEFYINTKSKKARINMEILKRQTDSIRGSLNGSITGVAQAVDNTFNLNPAMNVKRAPSSRKQVDVQANTAILTELVKQTEIAKVTVRKETPLIQIIDAPIYPLKKEKFAKIKGIVLGGLFAVFIAIMYLVIKRLVKELNIN
jgi:Chain length determinant protein